MNRKQRFARNTARILRGYRSARCAPVVRTVPAGLLCSAAMLATVPAFVITKLVPFTYDDKPNDK